MDWVVLLIHYTVSILHLDCSINCVATLPLLSGCFGARFRKRLGLPNSNLTPDKNPLHKELEGIQRRAARSVNNLKKTDRTTSMSALIESMNWTHLKDRRETRRIGLFRAMHFSEVATKLTDYLIPQMSTAGYTRRHQMLYHIPHCNTVWVSHMNSFFIKTAKAWNQLPPESSLLIGPPVAD